MKMINKISLFFKVVLIFINIYDILKLYEVFRTFFNVLKLFLNFFKQLLNHNLSWIQKKNVKYLNKQRIKKRIKVNRIHNEI